MLKKHFAWLMNFSAAGLQINYVYQAWQIIKYKYWTQL